MPKYYVRSGQLYFIIDAIDHGGAILATLKYFKGRGLTSHEKICVTEVGFDDNKHISCYNTDEYLRKLDAKDN